MQEKLVDLALDAMKNAYAPYSHFLVGAALLAADGKVYTGCNVENGSYGATVCAERVALFKAVSEGKRQGDFATIAVVGGHEGKVTDYCPPCGICRQALAEFSPRGDLSVILWNGEACRRMTLADLLPESFSL